MRRFCIVSHGRLAQGLRQSLSIFLGDELPFDAISAYVDGVDDAKKALADYVAQFQPDDTLVFLTDIMGGSVNQQVMPYLTTRPNTYVISGVNFPLCLELSTLPEDADGSQYKEKVLNLQKSIVYMNDVDLTQFASEDDE